MTLALHTGDTWHSDRYDRDMTVLHVVDETDSGIGTVVFELVDVDGWAYFLIEGICTLAGAA